MTADLEQYLAVSAVIDWKHPAVHARARILAAGEADPLEVTRRCFEWVRDEIRHSGDYRLNPVTYSASVVLAAGTGFCYAKSHLLAALLRANGIPAGLCYQRLSRDDNGPPFCLHGLNAVHLPEIGWYRIDPRGNKAGVDARFEPPVERLAFPVRLEGESDLPGIWAEPRPDVLAAMLKYRKWNDLWANLPDASPEQ
jgi:transglutaminase-like putative cysteine protease